MMLFLLTQYNRLRHIYSLTCQYSRRSLKISTISNDTKIYNISILKNKLGIAHNTLHTFILKSQSLIIIWKQGIQCACQRMNHTYISCQNHFHLIPFAFYDNFERKYVRQGINSIQLKCQEQRVACSFLIKYYKV